MDLEAPETTKDDLLNKPVASTVKEDDEDPYFKIADPKPIESEIVVIKKANFCFGFILFITIFLALAAGIPFYRYFPFIPPILFLLAVIFILCLFKKYFICISDKLVMYKIKNSRSTFKRCKNRMLQRRNANWLL